MSQSDSNIRGDFDTLMTEIADYVLSPQTFSNESYITATHCLKDSLGCAILALNYPACTRLLGTLIPDLTMTNGVPIPGTNHRLDPVTAAFNIGTLIRWLDYNDTWLADEWGHPSDNLGTILAVADYVARRPNQFAESDMTLKTVLTYLIKAHEIQGIMALNTSFNRQGLDHVALVKLASTAVACAMMGADRQTLLNALSQVFVDGQSLRTYRHAPNTGSRKSWAAGDACARAVRLSQIALTGEMGYPTALTAPRWGCQDVLFEGKSFSLAQPLGSYVMDNILFKISYPAEFHAQTAVEAAIRLHPEIRDRIEDIDKIMLETQEPAVRIISKSGPLHNPADRDHCLQYMVAVGLLFGELTASHYEDDVASLPALDALREKMFVEENAEFTKDYYDADKRAISNAIQIIFKDGTQTDRILVDYPVGHRRRREEGIPLLEHKFLANCQTQFDKAQVGKIDTFFKDSSTFYDKSVVDLLECFVAG